MVIQYYGKGYIKVALGDQVISINPTGKDSDVKGPRFGASIVLSSLNHSNYNGVELAVFGDREPVVVNGPGEYEIEGVFIKGFPTTAKGGKINTVFSITFDDINICHLGAPESADISAETKGALGEIDILFVPTYNEETLDAGAAYKLSTVLDPKITIPLFYGNEKNDTLKKFLKESGESAETLDKFVVKRKDLEGKEGEVVIVKSF